MKWKDETLYPNAEFDTFIYFNNVSVTFNGQNPTQNIPLITVCVTQPNIIETLPPTETPSNAPSLIPTLAPTYNPSKAPTNAPTTRPTDFPTVEPTPMPSR